MPGSVQVAAPTTVLPRSLCSAFVESREFPLRESGPYTDGRSQRYPVATVSRREWDLSKFLTFAEWTALETFYLATKASPFYWYPVDADFDADGSSTTGRVTVCFEGSLSRTYALGRQGASLKLVEIS